MSRYRKSIHSALEEVSEWEAPKEPEVIVEEAPIPTETGREPVSYTHLTLPTKA